MECGTAISDLLDKHDVLGARGCDIHERVNVMVKIESRQLSETKLILKVCQFSPEGFGKHEFWNEHINVPAEAFPDANGVSDARATYAAHEPETLDAQCCEPGPQWHQLCL